MDARPEGGTYVWRELARAGDPPRQGHNARVLEALFGLIFLAVLVVTALVLPILSFVRAQDAKRIARGLQVRVADLEDELRRLRSSPAQERPMDDAVAALAPVAPDPVVIAAGPPPTPIVTDPPPPADAPRFDPIAVEQWTESQRGDLEQQIGSRWLLYAGIAAVVLGMSYFVKFAFDNGWISEPLRVLSGIAIGLGLVGVGMRFSSRGLAPFGQALAGGGIVVLYVSIYAALHFYQLIAEAPAFALMVVVTAGAAWLADRQRSQPLAALALLGGFATPMLVGGGSSRQVVLFTYIAILISGTAVLARRQAWPLLSAASYVCTFQLVIAWFFSSYESADWLRTELFLTLYVIMFGYLLWSLLATCVRSPQAHTAVAVLLTAPLAYHLASIVLLYDRPAARLLYVVLATVAGLTVSQRLGATWLRVLVLLLAGIPALFWLNALRDPNWYLWSVLTMFVIYGLHLVAQWEAAGEDAADGGLPLSETLHTQANGLLLPLALYVFLEQHAAAWTSWAVAALAAWNAGLATVARVHAPRMGLQFIALSATLAACAIVLAFDGPVVAVGWAVEGVLLGWLAVRERSEIVGAGSGVLIALGCERLLAELARPLPVGNAAIFNPRALAAALVIGSMAWLAWRIRNDAAPEVRGRARNVLILTANVLGVLVMSSEIHAFFEGRSVDGSLESAGMDVRSAGLAEQLTLSVSWALYAVGLIAVGIRRAYAPARYLAIALFGVTVVKVLLNDIAGLDRFHRMLTVLGVGVLLLVASFLYQRRSADSAGKPA